MIALLIILALAAFLLAGAAVFELAPLFWSGAIILLLYPVLFLLAPAQWIARWISSKYRLRESKVRRWCLSIWIIMMLTVGVCIYFYMPQRQEKVDWKYRNHLLYLNMEPGTHQLFYENERLLRVMSRDVLNWRDIVQIEEEIFQANPDYYNLSFHTTNDPDHQYAIVYNNSSSRHPSRTLFYGERNTPEYVSMNLPVL